MARGKKAKLKMIGGAKHGGKKGHKKGGRKRRGKK